MLVKQELVNKIKDYFELNIYETKVWLALLGKGIASAGEVAELSGVPRSRTYDILESLEKKGFAIMRLGKPVKYIGIKPRTILDKLKENVKREAEKKIVGISNVKKTNEFNQLEELYNKGVSPVRKEDLSVALRGKSNISHYLKEIFQNAKKEVILCTNAEEVKSKIKLFSQTLKFLKKENVKIKFALSGNSVLIKQIEKELGIKIKQIDIDAKFFIIDKKEILFYLSEPNKEDIAIWINSEFFSDAFANLFEKILITERNPK